MENTARMEDQSVCSVIAGLAPFKMTNDRMVNALYAVLSKAAPAGLVEINDGPFAGFPQATPKARILAALELAKTLC